MNLKNRVSLFSDDWAVLFIGKNYDFYDDLKLLFSEFGIAFSILNEKCVIIDSEQIKDLTDEHVHAIEAHELAHYLAGHYKRDEKEDDELEADRIAIELLELSGMHEAADYLIDRMLDRNIKYEDIELSDNVKDALRQYIK
jgi:hypothetical protein